MVLKQVQVSNHQSLLSVDVELGGLTVVVGRTDSGKSSFLRAVRMLFANTNSPSAVTHGKSSMTVRADFDEGFVALSRGKGLSEYRMSAVGGEEQSYPKSGTKVPDDVQRFLNLAELDSSALWWSTQHDSPLLLGESGSKVSAVLGSLTAATTLYEATRGASRKRLKARSDGKVRSADVESAVEKIRELGDVRERREAARRARDALKDLRQVSSQVEKLQGLVARVEYAEGVQAQKVTRTEAAKEQLVAIEAQAVAVETVAAQREDILALVRMVTQAEFASVGLVTDLQGSVVEIAEWEAEHERLLIEAGVCPTCDQVYEGGHSHV